MTNNRPERKLIFLDDTRTIFMTNFSGDPSRDKFGSDKRKVNLVIPTLEQAQELMDAGINVRTTKPRDGEEEDFVPTYFVSVTINYNSKFPPKVYLVSGNAVPVLLDEDSVDGLDNCRISNINAVLNPYYNPNTNRTSLYVTTMYVEQDIESDPYAGRYTWGGASTAPEFDPIVPGEDDLPF